MRGIAIHLRHAAIHESQTGLSLLPQVQRLAAIDGDYDSDTDLTQHLDDHLAVDGIVVGDALSPSESSTHKSCVSVERYDECSSSHSVSNCATEKQN